MKHNQVQPMPVQTTACDGIRRAGQRLVEDLRHFGLLHDSVMWLRQMRNQAIDRWLNIRTPYPVDDRFDLNTRFGDAVPNEPVDYLLLRKFMKPVRIQPDDIMFDIGCGMGRTLCLFARRSLKRCVGIEFDQRLVEIARANIRSLRGVRTAVEVRCGDAVDADYSGGTIFWLFNPFGESTLRAVMARIEQSLQESPRPVQVVYVNPVHGHVLNSLPWLHCVGHMRSVFFNTYGASYWRSS